MTYHDNLDNNERPQPSPGPMKPLGADQRGDDPWSKGRSYPYSGSAAQPQQPAQLQPEKVEVVDWLTAVFPDLANLKFS